MAKQPLTRPPLAEGVVGLKQNMLYQHLLAHLAKRRDGRIAVAMKTTTDVDVMRGRAQELMDLTKELGG
jgi:hypothetical protein